MLDIVLDNRLIILIILVLLFIIFMVLIFRTKKVKPINMEEILDKKDDKSKIEEVLEALENNTNDRPMTTFEQEQEENAIISYQELVKAVQEKKANSEFKSEPLTEIIKPIENDLEISVNDKSVEDFTEEILDTIEPVKPKFKNSEFISPIFGKDTATSDDFLKELKDLRKNL